MKQLLVAAATILMICSCQYCKNGAAQQKQHLVTPETLQAFFPENLGDFKRVQIGSEILSNGYKMVQSSALYQDEKLNNRTILVTIHDTGSNVEAIKNAAPWCTFQQNNKLEDNSYERTGTFNAYPAYEKFDEHYRSSTLSFLINNRFAVDINGSVCFMYDVKAVISKFDFGGLEQIK